MADDYTPSVDEARERYIDVCRDTDQCHLCDEVGAEFDRMIAQVRAEAIRSARDQIMPPYNFELRSDGTESPELAAYVEIMHEVHDRLSEVADRIEKEAGL